MPQLPKLPVLAALAATGVLCVPTAANATVAPPAVVGDTLTVTSDDGSDTITLAAAGGVLTVNGNATTLAANANAQIVVDAGAGEDVVDASALAQGSYGSITLDAGPGRDTVTGGAGTDSLTGGPGNDRLVGFRGVDDVFGGEGDDVMVWNNGDNTDTNTGDLGTDEVEVNGSPLAGDVFTVAPSATAGGVQLDRTNLITFGITLTAERLTINGLGGEDQAGPDPGAPTGLAPLTSLRLNGGAGADSLDGGDGADLINGGADSDALFGNEGADLINGGDEDDFIFGNGGDDRLVGDRGVDLHVGGDGDDELVWNNGDGSDTSIGGEGFDRAEVNGSATGGDAFELAPDGDDAVFRRTNLVPFSIDLSNDAALALPAGDLQANGGVEAVTVNGSGGDDAFTVAPGLPGMLVLADGGTGDDDLTGAEESDQFAGGIGDDLLTPGGGSDLADAGDGDDQLFARDGATDLVRGGAGADIAETDSIAVDFTEGVEKVDATPLPPAADTSAELPVLGKAHVRRQGRHLVADLPLTCPAAEAGGCRATVTLETAKAVRLGKVRTRLVLGSKTVQLTPGAESVASVRLADGVDELAKRGRLQVRARLASTDAAGNEASRTTKVGLRIPRAGKGGRNGGQRDQHPDPVTPAGSVPAFGSVTIRPDGPGFRLVTVETSGPPMSIVEICDLSTPACVPATLESGRWTARIPAPDPKLHSIGFIGRSGAVWATANSSSTPPAPIPPPVNVG